jgi:hypothetical protein
LIAGDDGGIWYSYDGGNKWWKGENLPISQFYHVSVDMEMPYRVYGGLQDNSSWVGDSQYPGGITNSRWENMYGGDGFWMFVDPTDTDIFTPNIRAATLRESTAKQKRRAAFSRCRNTARQTPLQLEHSDSRHQSRNALSRLAVSFPLER